MDSELWRNVPARRVDINLGTRCNNRCVFCMSGAARDQRDPWASFDTVRAELRHFRERGCQSADFLGGEPTAYPHLERAVACAKDLGFRQIAICTNGARLADADYCRRLLDAGLTRVTLSVHSHDPRVEDSLITRVPGSHARKVAALRNLVAARDGGRLPGDVSLNPVLCGPTLLRMESYLALFGGLGARDVRFNLIWPQGEVRRERRWIPPLREAAPEIVRIMLLQETQRPPGRRVSFGGLPRCALLLAGVSRRLCAHLAERYLDEAGLDRPNDVSMTVTKAARPPGALPARRRPSPGQLYRFVWQEQKTQALKMRAPACGSCRARERCEGVWRSYAKLYGVEELAAL